MVAAVAELLLIKLGHCEIQFRPLRDKIGSAHKTYRDLGPIQETWRDPLDQKSAPGQSRRFDCVPPTSALPPSTDIVRSARQVRFVHISGSSGSGAERRRISLEPFIGPLVKRARRALFMRQGLGTSSDTGRDRG